MIKTFKDLIFEDRNDCIPGTITRMFFDNGYGISVITGPSFYTSEDGPYEVAVVKGTKESSYLCYGTPITNDVIGYCTEEKVTEIMKQIQMLERAEK